MSDQLEKWFDRNREEMDLEAPPKGHSERFAQKLNLSSGQTGAARSTDGFSGKWMWAAAAMVAVLIAVSFLLGRAGKVEVEQISQNSLASVSPEMAEVEDHLITQVAIKMDDLRAYTDADKALIEENFKILEKLEKEYELLKTDLAQNHQDQRVINSMIMNYRIRIKVMDRMLNSLGSINHKTRSDEDLHI